MFTSHQLQNGILGNYCDGEQYQYHPLFKLGTPALQIALYYDELEVCNPLGSKASIHKLGKDSLYMHMLAIIIQCMRIHKIKSCMQTNEVITRLQDVITRCM